MVQGNQYFSASLDVRDPGSPIHASYLMMDHFLCVETTDLNSYGRCHGHRSVSTSAILSFRPGDSRYNEILHNPEMSMIFWDG